MSTETKSACWAAVKLPTAEPTLGAPANTAPPSVHALVTGETDMGPPAVTFERYKTSVARLIVANAGTLERSNCSSPWAVGDTTTVVADPKLLPGLALSI